MDALFTNLPLNLPDTMIPTDVGELCVGRYNDDPKFPHQGVLSGYDPSTGTQYYGCKWQACPFVKPDKVLATAVFNPTNDSVASFRPATSWNLPEGPEPYIDDVIDYVSSGLTYLHFDSSPCIRSLSGKHRAGLLSTWGPLSFQTCTCCASALVAFRPVCQLDKSQIFHQLAPFCTGLPSNKSGISLRQLIDQPCLQDARGVDQAHVSDAGASQDGVTLIYTCKRCGLACVAGEDHVAAAQYTMTGM